MGLRIVFSTKNAFEQIKSVKKSKKSAQNSFFMQKLLNINLLYIFVQLNLIYFEQYKNGVHYKESRKFFGHQSAHH